MDPQVSPDHYGKKYDSKRRFISYWHQATEILNRNPKKILEIGVGSGFLSTYLRGQGIEVTTLDHDERLYPNVVAEINLLPFPDGAFDIAAAFEVLEHIPYEKAREAFGELVRVSKSYIIISLPDATSFLRFEFPVPKITKIKKLYTLSSLLPKEHIFDGKHYWEIGKKSYELKKIIQDLEARGVRLEKTYRVFENPRHRFFIFKRT